MRKCPHPRPKGDLLPEGQCRHHLVHCHLWQTRNYDPESKIACPRLGQWRGHRGPQGTRQQSVHCRQEGEAGSERTGQDGTPRLPGAVFSPTHAGAVRVQRSSVEHLMCDTESHFLAPGASHCRLFRLQTPPPSPPCGVFFTWEYYPKPEMRAFHQERPIRGMTLIQRRYENDKCHHAGLHETADIRPFLISGKKGQPHRKVRMLLLVSFFGDP